MVTERIRGLSGLRLVAALIALVTGAASCAQESKPCLEYAYPNGQVPGAETAFDNSHDALNTHGASFSCGPAIAASQARDALESFRYGVLYRDKTRLDTVLRYPLTVRIRKTLTVAEKPKVVTVHNSQEWSTLQSEEMNKLQIAVIACSWLGNVTVSAGRSPGFFIGDGMVWFQRGAGSAKVWVTSINLMPLTAEMLTSSCAP